MEKQKELCIILRLTPTHVLTEMKTTNALYCLLLSPFKDTLQTHRRANEQRGHEKQMKSEASRAD